MLKKDKVLPLESLRGIAAISVAIFHFNHNSHIEFLFENSGLMVDFFFVLSGFVISMNYLDRINSTRDLLLFQKKRFLRLYPLHFLMLFIFLVIELLKLYLITYTNIHFKSPVFEKNTVDALIANIFLLHNFIIPYLSFNGPSWSISAEFITYLTFASFVILTKKHVVLRNILFIKIIIFSGYFLLELPIQVEGRMGPIRCLFAFYLGSLAQIIYSNYFSKIQINSSIPSTILLLFCILSVYFSSDYKYLEISRLIPLLFTLSIISLMITSTKSKIFIVLSNRALVYLGSISYGIYMIHYLIWTIIDNILERIFYIQINIINGKILSSLSVLSSDLILLLGLLITIFLAHLSFKYFESKFIKF